MHAIKLQGLRVLGRHGVLAEEQARAQPFQVDAELVLDLSAAGASDALSDTIDYGALAGALAAVVRDESHLLMERLVWRLLDVCLADRRVEAATVEVTKLRPPVPEALDAASVRVTRSRSSSK